MTTMLRPARSRMAAGALAGCALIFTIGLVGGMPPSGLSVPDRATPRYPQRRRDQQKLRKMRRRGCS